MKNTVVTTDRATLQKTLDATGQARIAELKAEQPPALPIVPDGLKNIPVGTPCLFSEASESYRSPRSGHPRSTNRVPLHSYDLRVNYSSYAYNDLISPRPLLMIAGSEADTLYFCEEAISRAKEPKELLIIKGKTVGLYDDLTESFPKFLDFVTKSLAR